MRRLCIAVLSLVIVSQASAQNLMISDVNQEIPNAKAAFHGLRAFKTVMPGVLYRGGGSGGQRPMSEPQTAALCEAGFSSAGYLYSTGMTGDKSVSCQTDDGSTNTLSYKVYGFRPRNDRRKTLEAIHNIIKTGAGPMFVHCWNGWHASGEIAALALMQFCGWSGEKAGNYWKQNIGDQANLPKYGKIPRTHIGEFVPFEDLQISQQDRDRVCP